MKTSKRRRRYSLFEKKDGKWVRISSFALFKASAVNHWQGILISSFFEGRKCELRPVPTCKVCGREQTKNPKPEYPLENYCQGCEVTNA